MRERKGLDQTVLARSPRDEALAKERRHSAAPRLPRVLCVDDEPLMLSTLRRVLRCSFEVVSHPDPLAALALVQQGSSFAVVVADLNMPGMSGLELLGAIRAISPATVCILWTGDLLAARAAGGSNGVFRSLGKQCALATLRQTIADAAEQHQLLSRVPPEAHDA